MARREPGTGHAGVIADQYRPAGAAFVARVFSRQTKLSDRLAKNRKTSLDAISGSPFA
jgi:hypothetical protein